MLDDSSGFVNIAYGRLLGWVVGVYHQKQQKKYCDPTRGKTKADFLEASLKNFGLAFHQRIDTAVTRGTFSALLPFLMTV